MIPDFPFSYTGAGRAVSRCVRTSGRAAMVETRIKPHREQVAEDAAREERRRAYRRNEVFGLVLLAAAICLWWLFHTHAGWIFPPGWWRW